MWEIGQESRMTAQGIRPNGGIIRGSIEALKDIDRTGSRFSLAEG